MELTLHISLLFQKPVTAAESWKVFQDNGVPIKRCRTVEGLSNLRDSHAAIDSWHPCHIGKFAVFKVQIVFKVADHLLWSKIRSLWSVYGYKVQISYHEKEYFHHV